MGLDMYLHGEVYLSSWDDKQKFIHNNLRVEEMKYRIGYWRKHPNLHGYIVQTFAKGVDECQKIHLTTEQLLEIKVAVNNNDMPHTEGFFFGTSLDRKDPNPDTAKWAEDEYQQTIKALDDAITFLNDDKTMGTFKEVYYQASW